MNLESNVEEDSEIKPVPVELDRFSEPTTRLDYTGTKRQESGITRHKLVKSGNMLEIYKFEHPIRYGHKSRKTHGKRKKSKRSEEYRSRSIIRAVNKVRRLIHLNFTEKDKFITLTFDNKRSFDIDNLESCLPYYQKFIRKLRAWYSDLAYITVPEFQKRGAVHYHILCNIPFIKKEVLQEFWPYGFSKPKAVKSTTHLSLYLCKYLSKRFDDKRKKGHRLYYSSQGLKRSRVFYGSKAKVASKYLKEGQSGALQYESEYKSTRNGVINYKQYLKEKK